MKRKMLHCLLLAALLSISACGDEATPSAPASGESPTALEYYRSGVNYEVANLVDNGQAIMNTVMATYAGISNTEFTAIARDIADYAIFPDNLESDADFATRMKNVFYSSNAIVNSWLAEQAILTNDPATANIDAAATPARGQQRFFGAIKKLAKKIVKSVGKAVKNVTSTYNAIKPTYYNTQEILRQVNTLKYQYNAIKGAITSVNNAIASLGMEMRMSFAVVNAKLGTLMKDMAELKGDVNILLSQSARTLFGINLLLEGQESLKTAVENMFVQARMDEALRDQNAFMSTYAAFENSTEASNFVWQNTQVSYQPMLNIMAFLDCAQAMQNHVASSDALPPMISEDSTLQVKHHPYNVHLYYSWHMQVIEEGVQDRSDYSEHTVKIDYKNPKKELAISLGNIDQLRMMMESNLKMNSVVFSGIKLKEKNSALAAQYLNLIQTRIKPSLIKTLNAMQSDFARFKSSMEQGSWLWVANSYPYGNSAMRANFCTNTAPFSWPEQLNINDISSPTANAANIQQFSAHIQTAYEDYLSDYLAVYAGKLIAFEVMLRSYIID